MLHLVFLLLVYSFFYYNPSNLFRPHQRYIVPITTSVRYPFRVSLNDRNRTCNVSMVEAAGTAPASESSILSASTTSALVYSIIPHFRCQALLRLLLGVLLNGTILSPMIRMILSCSNLSSVASMPNVIPCVRFHQAHAPNRIANTPKIQISTYMCVFLFVEPDLIDE